MVRKDQCVSLKQFENIVITLFRGARKGHSEWGSPSSATLKWNNTTMATTMAIPYVWC